MTKLCLSCSVEVQSIYKASRSKDRKSWQELLAPSPRLSPSTWLPRVPEGSISCHMHNSVSCFVSPKGPSSVNYFSYYLPCDSCEILSQIWTPTAAQSHPEEGKWEGSADLFFLASSDRMHWNDSKVWQRKFWKDIREHFSTEIVHYFILFYLHKKPLPRAPWASLGLQHLTQAVSRDWSSAILAPKRDNNSSLSSFQLSLSWFLLE